MVQSDDLRSDLSQTIVAMITSNMSRAKHPSRVSVSLDTPDGVQSGLKTDSVIMTDNLATILDYEMDRTIGAYPDMQRVESALRHTLGI